MHLILSLRACKKTIYSRTFLRRYLVIIVSKIVAQIIEKSIISQMLRVWLDNAKMKYRAGRFKYSFTMF